jgi:hypothetical protein
VGRRRRSAGGRKAQGVAQQVFTRSWKLRQDVGAAQKGRMVEWSKGAGGGEKSRRPQLVWNACRANKSDEWARG